MKMDDRNLIKLRKALIWRFAICIGECSKQKFFYSAVIVKRQEGNAVLTKILKTTMHSAIEIFEPITTGFTKKHLTLLELYQCKRDRCLADFKKLFSMFEKSVDRHLTRIFESGFEASYFLPIKTAITM